MKIRNGFVSNSSSSSFVLAFNEELKSASDVCRILFGYTNKDLRPDWYKNYDDLDKSRVGPMDISEYFYNNSKKLDDDYFKSEDGNDDWYDFLGEERKDFDRRGYYYYYDDFMDEANNPYRVEKWELLEMIGPDFAKAQVESYKKQNPNTHLYKIEVGNECGYVPTFMEDQSLYENVDIAFYKCKH